MTEQEVVESLEREFGRPVVRLLEHMEIEQTEVEALFLLPHDNLPSLAGTEAYARAVSKVMTEQGYLARP